MAKLITRVAEDIIERNDINLSCFLDLESDEIRHDVSCVQEWVRDRVRAKLKVLKPTTKGVLAHQSDQEFVYRALPSIRSLELCTPSLNLELIVEAALLLEMFRILLLEKRINDVLEEEYFLHNPHLRHLREA